MKTIIMSMKVHEGKFGEAIKILKELVPTIRETELDTIAFNVYTNDSNTDKIYFYEEYKDDEAYMTHRKNLTNHMLILLPVFDVASGESLTTLPDNCKKII